MMSIKAVNAITHYTDWVIAHVHISALLWNGGLTFGMLYYVIPKMYGTKLYSNKMANFHFWSATLGVVLYAVPMYWGALTQQLMWKEFTPEGNLMYPNFLETVTQLVPMYITRAIGGTLYLIGALSAVYNLAMTMKAGTLTKDEEAKAAPLLKREYTEGHNVYWHRVLERKPVIFTVLVLVAISIGGLIEYIPTTMIESNVPKIASVMPYTPLELTGRDIYIREGCNTCHSQMIRPFRSETERYGDYSKAGEFVYDRPFLWGSKRTGPDLHRVGGKYPDSWHYLHMREPSSTSPGSLMPAYSWMHEHEADLDILPNKIKVLTAMGVPYAPNFDQVAKREALRQAEEIAQGLSEAGFDVKPEKEIVALIAYLQRLGTDIKSEIGQEQYNQASH